MNFALCEREIINRVKVIMFKLIQVKRYIFILSLAILSFSTLAKNNQLSNSEIEQLTRKISKVLQEEYIFLDDAKKIADLLNINVKSGKYFNYNTPEELSIKLTEDLRSINNDVHLNVLYTSPSVTGMRMIKRGGSEAKISKPALQTMKRNNFGFESVKILDGNIGYINLTSFMNPDYAGETAVAAMQFLSSSDAIIFDLRENRGGAGEMYQLLASYLFDEGPVQLNEIYWPKEDRRYQTWTLPHVPGKRFPNKKVYILTSGHTGSAAEVFSYSLKHYDRATLIGETTVGAANPVSPTKVTDNFSVWLSKAEAKNPVTKTNWEGIGVQPHIKTTKAAAFNVAHAMALEDLAKSNPDSKAYYQWFSDIVKAKSNNVEVTAEVLASYVGVYKSESGDQRVLAVKNGSLFYGPKHQNMDILTPLSQQTFMLPGNHGFKLKIELVNNEVVGIKRLFDSGRVIPMKRVVSQ